MSVSGQLLLRIADFLRSRQSVMAADVASSWRKPEAGPPTSSTTLVFPWKEKLGMIIQEAAAALQGRAGTDQEPAPIQAQGEAAAVQALLSEAWLVRQSFVRALNRFQVEQSGKKVDFTALEMMVARQEAAREFDDRLAATLAEWLIKTAGHTSVPASSVRDLHGGLRGIQGLLQIALQGIPASARGQVAAAAQQLARLASSTQELLEGDPHPEQPRTAITPALPPTPVQAVVALTPLDVTSFVRVLAEAARPVARKKGIRLEAMCNPGPTILQTDAARLHRAATLLIDYAVGFTDQGEVSIVSGANEEGTWTLEIRDSSAGVPPERLAKLLQGVAQTPDDAAAVGDATLGIALARDLAQLLGGKLEATSEPGEGNCFVLTLPVGSE